MVGVGVFLLPLARHRHPYGGCCDGGRQERPFWDPEATDPSVSRCRSKRIVTFV
ncbi:hypothetical protein HNR72_005267 [Streptomyces collinus]|uniref:Uncharacterized protein n=1 Tax=Streptomyces collinus TaxID=42684 RepID=A0AA89TJ99_STRCU|nr:hypothetical protein [Streptomyces collinus]